MSEFLRRERKDKHGVHKYSLDQFGISPTDIAVRYARYIEFLQELKAA